MDRFKWKMENGKWIDSNGNGKWIDLNGKWKMENGSI